MAFNSSTSPLLTSVSVSADTSYGLEASQVLTASADHGMILVNTGSGGALDIQTVGNLQSLAELTSTGIVALANPGNSDALVTATIQSDGSILIDDSGAVGGTVGVSVVPSTTLQLHQAMVNDVNVHIPVNSYNFVNGSNTTFEGVANGSSTNIICNVEGVALSDGPFIITQDDASLTGASNLGGLSTGIVYSTVSGGISTVSTTTNPTMSGSNIQSNTIPVASVVGTAVNLNSVQSISGAKTFTSTVTASDVSVVSGSVNMNDHTIINVTDPVDPQDAATKAYVDSQTGSPSQWSTFPAVQNVDMDSNKLINLTDPTSAQDAATKAYVDANASGNHVSLTTTNAVETDFITIAIPTNSSISLKGFVSAINASPFNATIQADFFAGASNVGGTASLTDTPFTVILKNDVNLDISIVISGTNLVVKVIGLAGQSVNWAGSYSTVISS